jgi:hypothetical protein
MASEQPPDEQGPGGGAFDAPDEGVDGPGGGTYETLRRLERRLDEASQTAERLISEAAASAASAVSAARANPRRPPAAGWQIPSEDQPAGGGDADGRDLELLAQVLQSLRDLVPPELQRRLAQALREVLLAVRALIDWYLERLERRRAEPVEVQDIPIV